jgi:hypothetical protein
VIRVESSFDEDPFPRDCEAENEARQIQKLHNEVGTPAATMAPRHVERLHALAGTVGRNVVVPFMLRLRLASFFR